MNMVFASERQRQMMLLRQKKIKSVLLYNLQEVDRKRSLKESQKHQFQSSYQTLTSQGLETLSQQHRRKSMKKEIEKKMLRDTYERQIRERQQKIKHEKLRDQGYLERQKAYLQYEEARRMADLQKMFDRITYQGVPLNGHKRSRTEPILQQTQAENPEAKRYHLPSITKKQLKTEGDDQQVLDGEGNENHVTSTPPSTKKNLDNIYVQNIQKLKRNTPTNLN